MYEELGRRQFENRDLAIRKIETIKNGVDTYEFLPAQDWPAEDNYILFVGRLVGQKGVEYLLRAFYYVKEKFPDTRLKIVGYGNSSAALQALSVNLLLSDKVDFLGWKTGQDLVGLYQKAQVVVVPSIYEPFGMTALEALACQRPVVASRVGGLQEIIEHGVTGFLARPKDELDLAQWIMTLLSSPSLRHDMGKAGREHVLSNGYTWPEIAGKFMQLYAGLLDKPISLEIPDRAEEIQKFIGGLAKKMFPTTSDNLVGGLFKWTS
jgi:glycosyltransferase involved in cell wall biosynthesis